MKKWHKSKINFVVDVTIMLAFVGLALSGFVMWLILPSGGYRGGTGTVDAARVFIFSREAWKLLHDWLSVSAVSGVLLHVVLHWNWIVCMTRNTWQEAFAPKKEPVPQEKCAI